MRYKPFTYMQTEISGAATPLKVVLGQLRYAVLDLDYTGSLIDQYNIAGTSLRSICKINNNSYLVGGVFTTIDGITRSNIAKIENGAVVTSGGWGGSGNTAGVQWIGRQSTKNFIVKAGTGGTYNGTSVGEIFRIDSNGNLGPSFAISSSDGDSITGFCIDSDDNLWMTGNPQIFKVNGVAYTKGIAKFDPNGNPITLISGSGFAPTNLTVTSIDNIGDKVFVAGSFTSYNGSTVGTGIIKLNSDGSVDTSFNVGAGMSGSLASFVPILKHLWKIGKVALIAPGASDTRMAFYSGSAVKNFALINLDGTLDSNFTVPPSASQYSIKDNWIDSDLQGNLYLCNAIKFNGVSFNNTSSNEFIKLDSTGSLASFDSSSFSTELSRFIDSVVVWG